MVHVATQLWTAAADLGAAAFLSGGTPAPDGATQPKPLAVVGQGSTTASSRLASLAQPHDRRST